MSLQLGGLPYSSACHSIPVAPVVASVRQSSGLLIRGFGVQVPGGAPGLTWGFTTPGLFLCVRFVHMFAPRLLGRTDPAIRVLSKTAHPAPDTGAGATGSAPDRPADAAPPPPCLRPGSTRPMV